MNSLSTPFTEIYKIFLGRITDDMYLELTPQDTIKDLRNLLINAIPAFEFPRHNLYDYSIASDERMQEDLIEDDFVIDYKYDKDPQTLRAVVETSCFGAELTPEEKNILAVLMMIGWVQRQVTSIENTRMKYSGVDFKLTSQANHLQKLLSLLTKSQEESVHLQRLYRRRKFTDSGYESNWSVLRKERVIV